MGESSAWRCTVCGYVHRGPAPPEFCPVCGAASSEFEPLREEPTAQTPVPVTRWRCLNCNYVHPGDEAPDACPVCGAHADRFEPFVGREVDRATDGAVNVVVLGAGIAGLAAAEAVRQSAPEARISLVSKEADLPYYRLNLTRYLAGEIDASALPIHPESWYADNGIELRCAAAVADFDPGAKRVKLHGADELAFDKLVLTVGAHPFVPPIPGAARECVTPLRTRSDAECILQAAEDGQRCICIGGGILGLETAGALARRGCRVTLIEGFGWLLPRQLNERAGRILEQRVAARGIELRLGAGTDEICGDERVREVRLVDGTHLESDLVVITTGIRPNSYLARRAGLQVNQGVVVDRRLLTSHPDVLAAGDVAEYQGTVYGIWAPALYQGRIAGMNAVGLQAEFGGIPRSNTLKVLGIDLFSIGLTSPEDASCSVFDLERDGTYLRLVFRDGAMRGAILLGDAELSSAVKKSIEEREDFSGVLQRRPSAGDILDHLRQMAG